MTTAVERLARQVSTALNIEEAKAICARVLGRKGIPKPPLPDRKAQRRKEHRDETFDLLVQVWLRCGGGFRTDPEPRFFGSGRCEVSGVELGAAWNMHHIVNGGARRSAQCLGNVLAVSWETHRMIHRGDLGTLRAVKEACLRLGLREGLRAIEYRLAKVDEAHAKREGER